MNVLVANARHIKAVPGWKTDVKDAEWIADLLRHGLIRGSAIPSRARRELREMVRYRLSLSRQRAQVAHRIQKVLEGANVKLSSVVTDLTGVSGRAMLEALITGTDSPDIIADLARGSWWSRLGCAQYDATDQDRGCARSTVPRAVDQRRMQARASADCEASVLVASKS